MAKRKRLTPARAGFLSGESAAAPLPRAPIADIAGDAASSAAFEAVAGELTRARIEGRMILRIPLDDIAADHLIRDRIALEADSFEELKASLRARGQQTPIDVMERSGEAGPAYGLIAGWRRLMALRDLQRETGEARFDTALALLRQPEERADAYLAMVEENEIRSDLSFYERARIVHAALRDGVFESDKSALQGLFPAVSYSKRSKIKTFLGLVDRLDDVLRHPQQLSEHAGLALSRALDADPSVRDRIAAALNAVDAQDAEAEAKAVATCIRVASNGAAGKPKAFRTLSNGLAIQVQAGRIVLKGSAATTDLARRIEEWIADQT